MKLRYPIIIAVLCFCGAGAFVKFHFDTHRTPIKIIGTDSGKSVTLLNMPGDAMNRTVLNNIDQYVNIPEGAVNWHTFGATKQIDIEGKTPDGYDFQYYKPQFSSAVRALDGREITIKGFMFPLDEKNDQSLFLFGPFPINCPFHYHVGPSLVMEVHADKHPIAFSYDAITLRGHLQLVPKDSENSTFYRLLDARMVKS